MRWTDYILVYVGVKHITAIKEVWVLATICVLLLQLVTAARVRRVDQLPLFSYYLTVAALRDVGHYFSWWGWGLEEIVAFFTISATASAVIGITYPVLNYQRRYARTGLFILAGACTCLAAYQVPPAYPNYNKIVYFIRLYTNTFCALALLWSLVYICKNWNFRILKDRRSINAIALMAWLGTFVWADRQMVIGDAWFRPALTKLAIQGCVLAVWIVLASAGASKASDRKPAFQGSRPFPLERLSGRSR